MFAFLKLLIPLAMSSQGRRVIRELVRFLKGKEGQKLLAQARRVTTGPEAQKLASQFAQAARRGVAATNTPQNRGRVRTVGRTLRARVNR